MPPKNWCIITYAETVPNIITICDLTKAETAMLERRDQPKPYEWFCHSCSLCECKHTEAAREVGYPDSVKQDGKWWFTDPIEVAKDFDPVHAMCKAMQKIINVIGYNVIGSNDTSKYARTELEAVQKLLAEINDWRRQYPGAKP